MRFVTGILLGVLTVLGASRAQATTFSSYLKGYASASQSIPYPPVSDFDEFDTGLLADTDTIAQMGAQASLGPAAASSTGFIEDGVFHGAVSASTSTNNNPAMGHVQFNYTDTLTLISSTLAPGTAVSLQLSFLPSYTMSTTGGPCGTIPTGYSASVFASSNLSGLGNTRYVDEACDLNDDLDSHTIVAMGVIGQQTTLGLSMTLTAGATGGSASIDALNTARVFIDPLGDFTYVTASGNMYLTPPPPGGGVPEPATWLVLALGLGVLGLQRRRA